MKKPQFVTCINCMDGRTQEPVIKFLKKKLRVHYVDMVTEAGPDKIVAHGRRTSSVTSIKRRVKISIEKHRSKAIAIVGHYGCAGNPVSIRKHLKEIKASVDKIYGWKFGVPVLGLWVNKAFRVERVILREDR